MKLHIRPVPPYDPPLEFVERKGLGHPDTLCDALAENLACGLARHFRERHGHLKHFNVDKALLSAGEVELGYGGGRVITPTEIILAGKVDMEGGRPPEEALLREARELLATLLPEASVSSDFRIDLRLKPSGVELAPLVERAGVPRANDTSVAVASWPRSPLEESVLEVETMLNGASFRPSVPVGPDIKVMGFRCGDRVRMVVAAAMLAPRIPNHSVYRSGLQRIEASVRETVEAVFHRRRRALGELELRLNCADDPPDNVYLTLSGSSAEAGDDGQVGRGNRFGGLITPHRSMSIEAVAGKNPAAHVGKLHHAMAGDAARGICQVDGVRGATVRLLSEIGRPVDDPVVGEVEIEGELDAGVRSEVTEILTDRVADWKGTMERLLAGGYRLY